MLKITSYDDVDMRKEVFGSNKKQKPLIKSFLSTIWEELFSAILGSLLLFAFLQTAFCMSLDIDKDGIFEGFTILLAVLIATVVTAGIKTNTQRKFRIQSM